MLDLDAIEARANAATPGPWHWEAEDDCRTLVAADLPNVEPLLFFDDGWAQPCDREFVAHAREDVPALVAEVRLLRAIAEDALQRRWDGYTMCMHCYAAVKTNFGKYIDHEPGCPVAAWEESKR